MTDLVCAIHQPNFFPWLGYFDKIRRADIFVFLDAVDYPRSGSGGMGSWSNRVKLAVAGEARWIGCPLKRAPLGTAICDIEIDDAQPWRRKLLKTLEANYRKAPRFNAAMALLTPLVERSEHNLASFNIETVRSLSAVLGVKARFVRQSDLFWTGHATPMLIQLAKAAGANAYLAGGGAGGYQEDKLFGAAGISLRYQSFIPAPYGNSFTPGLSVIDYLMQDGRPLVEAFPDA